MKPQDLTGSAKRLYESYRSNGLSETLALRAATDERVGDQVLDIQMGRVFGRLTHTEEARQLRALEKAARTQAGLRPEADDVDGVLDAAFGRPPRDGVREAEYELRAAQVFGRAPSAWAVQETQRRQSGVQESTATVARRTVRVQESGAALATAGRVRVRVIAPGQGSSGYYSPEMLKRDGPRIFVPGVQSFLDHPTASEGYERPERSLRDLAGRLSTAAVWEDRGPLGPGLYADVDLFSHAASLIASVGPYIGVSIRAEGEIDRAGCVTALTAAHSVDFVTRAGAGGAIVT